MKKNGAQDGLTVVLSKFLDAVPGAKHILLSSLEGSEIISIAKSVTTEECQLIQNSVSSFSTSIEQVISSIANHY